MASLNTADMGGIVQNAAFDWGVVVNPKDGLAYVNDFNNGLWVVRVDPQGDRRTPAHRRERRCTGSARSRGSPRR